MHTIRKESGVPMPTPVSTMIPQEVVDGVGVHLVQRRGTRGAAEHVTGSTFGLYVANMLTFDFVRF